MPSLVQITKIYLSATAVGNISIYEDSTAGQLLGVIGIGYLNTRGQRLFLEIRDRVRGLLETAGAFTAGAAMRGSTGDSWKMLACIDRLLELGEIREVTADVDQVAAQHRVFTAAGSDR